MQTLRSTHILIYLICQILAISDPIGAHTGDFVCGQCLKARASQQAAADCGATLIICPASILQQWQSEIAKHTQPGALRVLTYLGQGNTTAIPSADIPGAANTAEAAGKAGISNLTMALAEGQQAQQAQQVMGKQRKGKHSGQGVVSAAHLAAADVVLTTYDVLQRDLHHWSDPEQVVKTLRTRKRYEVYSQVASRHHLFYS